MMRIELQSKKSQTFLTQTIVIRIEGHLTCAVDGVIYDTWNCSDKVADCFWIVNEINYKNF